MELKGRTIAITGIGGFIGLRAAELARSRGMKVRGLDLSAEAASRARALGAEVVIGGTTDERAAAEACSGADIILHTAAIVKEGGSMDEFRRVNVGGTTAVARAARSTGAKVFVHLSSVMVYGFTYPRNVTETGPRRGENNPYCQTKIESEDAILGMNDPPRFGVIVIRPGDVYGPGSVPWVIRPVSLMRSGRFALVDGGRGIMNHVYVDNLVDGIFLAVIHDAFGEAFNITDGAETTFREYFTRLAKAAAVRRPFPVPSVVLRPLARVAAAVDRIRGREPQFTPDAVAFVTRPHSYSVEKARKLLGYEPAIGLDEGMRRTGDWLQERGLGGAKT